MIIKAPNDIPADPAIQDMHKVFLAGSIEMGTAIDWQAALSQALGQDYLILNPRRDDWDNSWKQDLTDERFVEQVQWELGMMELADTIVFYFDPETKAPITLLELGLGARTGKALVCCPDGFYRKGNVDIVCRRYDVPQATHLQSLANLVNERAEMLRPHPEPEE